ncbi:MAG: hypothetical protein NHB14_03605 [Desulfosporosinus sp.]|nr:hypothetical protein [Desulfosporosinus sp.]
MSEKEKILNPDPGVCVPWEVKKAEIGEFPGNEAITKKNGKSSMTLPIILFGFGRNAKTETMKTSKSEI